MHGKSRRVTISQVAEAAGVDRSTVSRAFTRPDKIRAETTRHILRIAEELGYTPNQTARALSTGRTANVALLVPDLTNPFIPPLILGVQREADLSDFCVFIGNFDESPAQESKMLLRFAPQVAGTILVSSRADDAQVHDFAARTPLVLINRDLDGVPRILIDATDGVAEAMAHLVELGHRRIAYVGGSARSWSNEQRRRAAEAAAAQLGADLTLLSAGHASFDAGLAMVDSILASGTTAAIAFDDVLAQGILSGLAEHDREVPRDYSLIGCDDVLGAVTYPALTSISNRAAEAGKAAMRMLLDRLEEPGKPAERQSLGTSLVLRRTTAPPN
ncbi:LacI family DNA-binding transcriptional regulator [Frigidibacter sp. ROC022]|uniref:LacI family DNA-binding transcriptional regulator n=1 Tax=Frigidibacter sp. ROC022 TaxID=2971796 RepID=UPI00215ADC92|nr:LacI family DNA-binding transcriptional regulator [Frigidibacter sp. ROC022]MCR8724569.1 LacI family transcriptional regulator [Frigidibacter sp. ROC022]